MSIHHTHLPPHHTHLPPRHTHLPPHHTQITLTGVLKINDLPGAPTSVQLRPPILTNFPFTQQLDLPTPPRALFDARVGPAEPLGPPVSVPTINVPLDESTMEVCVCLCFVYIQVL